MKNIIILIFITLFFNNLTHSSEWKIINKWKISCGVVDKESLIVNDKPKRYSKNQFKVDKVSFKLDKGEIGNCKPDKKGIITCPAHGWKISIF